MRNDGLGVEAKMQKVTNNYVARRAGAPKGNTHALKHGRRSAAFVAERRAVQEFKRQARAAIREAKQLLAVLRFEQQRAKLASKRITNAAAMVHPQDVDAGSQWRENVQEKRAAMDAALCSVQ